jgi:hypothetical protein
MGVATWAVLWAARWDIDESSSRADYFMPVGVSAYLVELTSIFLVSIPDHRTLFRRTHRWIFHLFAGGAPAVTNLKVCRWSINGMSFLTLFGLSIFMQKFVQDPCSYGIFAKGAGAYTLKVIIFIETHRPK